MSEKEMWRKIKGKLIAEHGTITRVAQLVDCHPNAIRKAYAGKAPKVLDRLEKLK